MTPDEVLTTQARIEQTRMELVRLLEQLKPRPATTWIEARVEALLGQFEIAAEPTLDAAL